MVPIRHITASPDTRLQRKHQKALLAPRWQPVVRMSSIPVPAISKPPQPAHHRPHTNNRRSARPTSTPRRPKHPMALRHYGYGDVEYGGMISVTVLAQYLSIRWLCCSNGSPSRPNCRRFR
jgi:hypothetical protein